MYRRLFAELKRRKVFRVAAVYGAVGFAVLQGADVLIPALHLPPQLTTGVAVVVLLGFPIALVLAWAYERTPEGVKLTQEAAPEELTAIVDLPAGRRWVAGIAALFGTALLVAGGWWVLGRSSSGGYDSIAVLPFANLSDVEENEYLGDGLAEELLNALARIDGLKVAARTSAFAFRGAGVNVREIGETLGVSTVLEGSVRRSNERVRINVQLVDAADGFRVWSSEYDRKIGDLLELQDQIAAEVVEALSPALAAGAAPGSERATTSARTNDPAAYEEYLRGRYLWNKRTAPSIESAIEHFRRAIELDPAFALAWAGLADAYLTLQWYLADADWDALLEQGRAAAERALEIDPDLAQARTSLALYHASRWNWDEADAEFRRALEIDPDYSTARYWYAHTLAPLGRLDEAIEQAKLGAELDPLSLVNNRGYAMILAYAGRLDEALAELARVVALDSTYVGSWMTYTELYTMTGDWDRAADAYVKLNWHDSSTARAAIAGMKAFATTGEAQPIPQTQNGNRADRPTVAGELAMLGQADSALAMLERLQRSGSPNVREAAIHPWFRPLHSDPRFGALLAEIGLRPVRPLETMGSEDRSLIGTRTDP